MPSPSTSEKIRQAIRNSENQAFTTRDILNSNPGASRELVDQVISRMVRAGELERVSRGIFSLPKMNRLIGPLSPSPRDVIAAIERATGLPVLPSGAFALNALHLSTQVPARPEFLKAGPSRTINIRNLRLRLKHASVSRFRVKHYVVQLIFEALRFLGPNRVSGEDIKTIHRTITEADCKALTGHIGDAPVWMQPYLRQIAVTE